MAGVLNPVIKRLGLGKEEAAARQLDAAIYAMERGDYDIAVTLAGAAEGMIQRPEARIWPVIRDHPDRQGNMKE